MKLCVETSFARLEVVRIQNRSLPKVAMRPCSCGTSRIPLDAADRLDTDIQLQNRCPRNRALYPGTRQKQTWIYIFIELAHYEVRSGAGDGFHPTSSERPALHQLVTGTSRQVGISKVEQAGSHTAGTHYYSIATSLRMVQFRRASILAVETSVKDSEWYDAPSTQRCTWEGDAVTYTRLLRIRIFKAGYCFVPKLKINQRVK